jgi:hypothetical protein
MALPPDDHVDGGVFDPRAGGAVEERRQHVAVSALDCVHGTLGVRGRMRLDNGLGTTPR